MFEKFGEFDSSEELNTAAAGLLAEGDTEALKVLAAENGISDDELMDYVEGVVPELASPVSAALARLKVQVMADTQNVQLRVVTVAAQELAVENPDFAAAVMKKGKRLTTILEEMKKTAQKHTTGSGANRMSVCCGTDRELEKIIETYYLEPDKLSERLEALYQ